MSVYHQMGHDSKNLLRAPNLELYKGAILSPVNYCEEEVVEQISLMKEDPSFEMIFDPQLYSPKQGNAKLRQWTYFPDEADTCDMASDNWWRGVIQEVVKACLRMHVSSACSPAFTPKAYSDDYFKFITCVGTAFSNMLSGTNIKPLQTVVCGLNELAGANRAHQIASIVSQTQAESIYLVLVSSVLPRRELSDVEELIGAMKLISLLEATGLHVVVGFSSTEMVLWKAAGATACATGKYFNVRRFTLSRFDEPNEGGGGQLPYWFEESFMAFLRESDLVRVKNAGMISAESLKNPYSISILNQMATSPGKAWLALSWRAYLYSFADLEKRIGKSSVDVMQLLKTAEQNWTQIENKILMEEIKNNGVWLRSWRRALLEYTK